MTSKVRLTLPVEFGRELGLEPGDKLLIQRHGDVVVVRRAESYAARTSGALSAYRRAQPLTPRQEREAFEQAVADEQSGLL